MRLAAGAVVLGLSLPGAADRKRPWVTAEAFDDLQTAGCRYLAAEKDDRGFVPGGGGATPARTPPPS